MCLDSWSARPVAPPVALASKWFIFLFSFSFFWTMVVALTVKTMDP